MNDALKTKLSKLEAKIQPNQNVEKQEDSTFVLARYAYVQKQMQMTMTPQKIQRANAETRKTILDWYSRYQKMTPQEQKQELEKNNSEADKDNTEFKVWLMSEGRIQFDVEYKKRFGSGIDVFE